MSTSPDLLGRALDDAIGDGPPLPPLESHLDAGRRAVRRRRAASVAGVGAAVVLAATYAVAAGGPGPVAVDDDAAGPAGPSPTSEYHLDPDQPVGYTSDGDVVLREGLVPLDAIEDPLPVPAGHHADAVSIRVDGRVTYFLLSSDGREWSSVASAPRTRATPTLAAYVEEQRGTWDGGITTSDSHTGSPVPAHGSDGPR